jgi:hypothetical protein
MNKRHYNKGPSPQVLLSLACSMMIHNIRPYLISHFLHQHLPPTLHPKPCTASIHQIMLLVLLQNGYKWTRLGKTLFEDMQKSLDLFHHNKDVFIDLNACKHFNIPKVHSMFHYITSIRSLGTVDSLNTEGSEQLHIDYTKRGYHASNKNDYIPQMAKWLQRHEAIDLHTAYLQARQMLHCVG